LIISQIDSAERIDLVDRIDFPITNMGCSGSLITAPFDGPYTTFYWCAIVNIALSCPVYELFDTE